VSGSSTITFWKRLSKALSFSKDFVDDVIDREILHALIKELTERQKMVLNLVYFEEMRQQDVADYLGIKQQSVNDLLNRALKTMKKKAENEEF
jgi:RNA polymerase sigma factor (sigma-70 family)